MDPANKMTQKTRNSQEVNMCATLLPNGIQHQQQVFSQGASSQMFAGEIKQKGREPVMK